MIDQHRFGLNRIIAPAWGLAEFFDFAASVGINKVELRNDIRDNHPIDGMAPAAAARLAADQGVQIITINAMQKFNLASVRAQATGELKALLDLSAAIGRPAIVLCPNNDPADARLPARRAAETTEALAAFGPLFTAAGITGLVEPLGFGISSLASLVVAQDCIRRSGFSCYRTVIDTFHHFIGPEDSAILGGAYDVSTTGLVHVSGVEADIPVSDFRDEHRVMVGPADRMDSKGQVQRLDRLGYAGVYSFEPFSPAVQKLGRKELADAVRRSIEFIRA